MSGLLWCAIIAGMSLAFILTEVVYYATGATLEEEEQDYGFE